MALQQQQLRAQYATAQVTAANDIKLTKTVKLARTYAIN
jgi:hypothetical protein